MLKAYNKRLQGYATGVGDADSPTAHLDVAVSGAVAADMPTQARALVKKLAAIDGAGEKWKLVNLFIGGNDLCAVCKDQEKYGAAQYEANVREALDILKANVDRLIVNLIAVIDVGVLHVLTSFTCNLLHAYECKCAVDSAASRATVTSVAQAMHAAADRIAVDARYRDDDDFAVIVQPFMAHTTVPRDASGEPDFRFFALDCFHLSEMGHHAASVSLWNNLLEAGSSSGSSDGSKEQAWEGFAESYLCPNEPSQKTTPFIWVPERV